MYADASCGIGHNTMTPWDNRSYIAIILDSGQEASRESTRSRGPLYGEPDITANLFHNLYLTMAQPDIVKS